MSQHAKLPPLTQWNFWLGVVICVVTIGGFVFGTWYLMDVLEDEQQVPLARFNVQGQLQQTDVAAIREAILAQPLGSFFTADVDQIRARIEALPWVKQASLRKVWPDRLSVFVSEHQPQALWNADRLINEQDEVFRADVTKVSAQLPQLFGPEHAVEDTLSEFYRLQKMLSVNGFSIRALRLTDRFAVSLVLEQGIEIKLGREATLERIKRFIDLFPSMMNHENSKENKVDTVDLRYDTGAAVAWREAKSES